MFRFDRCKRGKLRRMLGISDVSFVVGMVGDFSYSKNPEFALQIFERLYEIDNKIKMLFVGDGPNRMEMEGKTKGKKYCENIIFYGYTMEVENVLNVLDLLILPSRSEGLPVCIIEAQANGLPCILSDVITKQCKLLDCCVFLSLAEPPEKWANLIYDYLLMEVDRDSAFKEVYEKGFDIKQTAEVIYNLYNM